MKKAIDTIKRLIYFPLWFVALVGYFIWNFIQMIWLVIKKRSTARKIIYSNLVQTWKEKLTGRPKIIIK